MDSIKSICQKSGESKCLITFHNCTRYKIIPIWIDFKSQPIEYRTLPRGSSMAMNTFMTHLWYFKVVSDNHNDRDQNVSTSRPDQVKILAIPEETIKLSAAKQSNDKTTAQNLVLGKNNLLICPLCKFLLRQFSREPTKIPCPHLKGKKFLLSDMNCQNWSNYNSTYIYSCNENTHREEHSQVRRNIYLVEVFYNLKELCFMRLRDSSDNKMVLRNAQLPASLRADYVQFISSIKKLDL